MTRFYDRDRLRPGTRLKSPAVISEYSATTLIPPGFRGRVDRWRNLDSGARLVLLKEMW